MVHALTSDLKFALRLARRQPWLVAAVVATVALGVGANTAITSVLNTVLLNPLGLRDTSRVMVARVHLNKIQMQNADTSGVEFREMRDLKDTFSAVAAIEPRAWTAEIAGAPVRIVGRAVTTDFFRVFAQKPFLGRFPAAFEQNSVVLSHTLWQSLFGSDPHAIGRKITLDGKAFQVVGVAAESFRFPAEAQAWAPLDMPPDRMRQRSMNMNLVVVMRVRSDRTPQQAIDRVGRWNQYLRTTAEGADLKKFDYGIDLIPLGTFVAGDLRHPLLLLWAAALVLALTACTNIAGLLLARATGRTREIAIRISVGASALQIFRQLMVESIALGIAGGLAGLALAEAAIEGAGRLLLPGKELLSMVTLNRELLVYGMLIAVASSVLFGLVPAFQLLRPSQLPSMARSRRRWFQNVFIAGEVAAAVLLLVVTGLLIKSLWTIESINPGFGYHQVTTAYVIKPAGDAAFVDRLRAALNSEPGVEASGISNPVPFSGGGFTSMFGIVGRNHQPGEPAWHAEAYQITPEYLPMLHIPLVRGRNISDADTSKSPLVCLIDAKLAKRFFPNEDPIGQKIGMYAGPATIVGIVENVRTTTLEEESRPVIYYSAAQITYWPWIGLLVRSRIPAAPLIRDAVRRASARVPVFDIKTMDQRIDESLGIRRIIAWLLGGFGIVGTLLAAVGVHGVTAQLAGEQTVEIGIRMALGAQREQILTHFLVNGVRAGVAGVVIGVAAAVATGRWIERFLYQMSPVDPIAYVCAMAGIIVVLVLAVILPSWRASRVDPQAALRAE